MRQIRRKPVLRVAQKGGFIQKLINSSCLRMGRMAEVFLPCVLRLASLRKSPWWSELQCRLERMERRMSMLSKSQEVVQQQLEATLQLKQSPNDHRLTQGSDQRLTTPEKAQTGGRRRRSLEPEVFNSFVSSKANQDDSRLREDQQQQNNNNNNKNVFSKPRKFAYRRRRREIQTRTESETDEIRGNDSESENTGIKFDLRQRIESRKRAKLEASKNRAGTKIVGVTSETQENKTEDVLRTDCLYVTTVCEFPLPPEPDIKLSKQAQVEVPTWRVNPVTNCYQLEGTENLTDESYSKKHLKPEMEERRRKRWDLQRLREQKMLEKLEKGRYKCHFADKSKGGTENHSQESTSSLLPSLDDIQYIEVCDKIAVSAFGYAIPHLEPSEFALPWGEASHRETTRMRTPQKRR
ncbi:male-specific lethal 1 homolog isoform X2 [Lingula anatina]|uniref:Male-specific lethal 1 homolog isoform X2 n=1 Tax=Lingula anatina TaxID=7574 RepID=A0A1S3IM93_LINAN|nr:male-specific lethal 1 homolog isoform X2 [Lingula anatina]|eukprot:XP_013399021.1 male-specific lethal 1 homolog isoform X2 [Lingula anatina]